MSENLTPDLTGKLSFETEKGASRAKWIAVILTIALVGWMGSGYIIPSAPDVETVVEITQPRAVVVAVQVSHAAPVLQVFSAEGQSEPDRMSAIRAETSGQVASVSVNRGDLVEAGQEIARIESVTLRAQLNQAEERVAEMERNYENALALQERGISTQDRVNQARTDQASAEAQLTAAREALENVIIRAPFTGRLNTLTLDEGEFVTTGAEVGQILDNDPLSVVIQVPQQALSRLERDQIAEVEFITGETLRGTVGYIGVNADAQTRTFRAEITVPNPDSHLPAGLSAQVRIPTGEAHGHFLSPAILSLGTDGELGIKTVLDDNRVAFVPVSIVRAQTDGIWVTGLPDQATIITVGQGFVNDGELVDPRMTNAQDATQ
jgi:multidrug efflux system membrane fusion protein